MRNVISDLLDEWAPRGEFDFVEFAAQFPIAAMCWLLGVSAEPIPRIRQALEDRMSSLTFNPRTKPAFLKAFDVLCDFADTLIRQTEGSGSNAISHGHRRPRV